jgi:23S rRNA pseudouridine955/2504/2580 synthase
MFTPSPVNRLDRNTSGIVIFGKNAKAVRDFSRMMASVDSVQKYYMALALGEIPDELTLDGGIAKDADRNMVSVSDSGRPSMTVVSPVESFRLPGQAYTLCEVRLVTGRPHQIRAHLAAAGHPVVGDPKYGDRRANRRFADSCGLESQFLHAHRLVVAKGLGSLEYLSGASMDSPLPRRLTTVMDFLRSRAGSAD